MTRCAAEVRRLGVRQQCHRAGSVPVTATCFADRPHQVEVCFQHNRFGQQVWLPDGLVAKVTGGPA